MVNCVKCGLLGVRDKYRRLMEVDEEPRRLCSPPSGSQLLFLCCAHEISFSQNDNDCRSKLHEERDCQAFIEWRPGFTPTEHKEMIRETEERERDRQWRENQARAQREWQERQAEREDARAKRDREWRMEDIRHLKTDLWVKILIPILAAAVGALSAWVAKG